MNGMGKHETLAMIKQSKTMKNDKLEGGGGGGGGGGGLYLLTEA